MHVVVDPKVLRELLVDRARRGADERIDAVVTHRVWGTLLFALTMLAVFTSIFTLAAPLMDGISVAIDALAEAVGAVLPEGAIRSLLVDEIGRAHV